MKNEFDDELDREKRKRGRHGDNSKPDPSDGDYYLDDDYEEFEEEKTGGAKTPPHRAESSTGNRAAGQGIPRPGKASGNQQNRSRSAAGRQIVIGDGGTRQQSRIPAREKPSASSRGASHNGRKRKIKRVILLAIAELFTLALIFSYAYVARIMGAIQRPDNFDEKQVRNEEMSAEQKKHMTGYRTIAVFGVDSRDGNVNKGTNADVIMICNINRDNGEIRLVSIFRDTYLNTNDGNTYNKINSAYAVGGPSQALAALNKNLDLDISEYVTFNWKSVADGINMLGGVDVNITKAEFRYINGFITETVKKTGVPSVHLKSAGYNHLDGVQAVAYARLRKMDTDFQRTERQRLIIKESFEKAKKSDLGLLNRILLMEVEQVGTNLTFSDFTELLMDITKYHIGETKGFPFTLGTLKMGKKGDCVIPQTLVTNVSELHNFLFGKENYQPSDMVKKISAKIAADSGMYKEGIDADDKSSTTKGSTKKKTEETKETRDVKTSEAEESSTQESSEPETDANGKPIKNGPGVSNGETKETRPTESSPYETRPGETRPAHSGGNTETTSGSHGPGKNETSTAHETTAAHETTTAHETTAPHETRAAETTTGNSAGPGEITSPQPGNGTAGGNTEAPIVPAPPAS